MPTSARMPSSEPKFASNLQSAFDHAMSFPISRCNEAIVSAGELEQRAAEEARFGRVTVDMNGLTMGMRLYAFDPVRKVLRFYLGGS